MKQIYLIVCCFIAISFLCLQGCNRDPKPQITAELPAPNTTDQLTTNTMADSTAIANQTTASDTVEMVTASETIVAAAGVEQTTQTQAATNAVPEKVKDGAALRSIADKVAAAKKEKQANSNKKGKQIASTQTGANEEQKTLTDIPEGEKPEQMNVMITEEKPERATASAVAKADKATMSFDKSEYNFGVVTTGKVVEHNFAFVNKGSVPLVIYDATSTCGCTIPEYPKEPIMPGQGGVIKVTYDSKGKIGTQDKPITITTNAGTHVVHLKGAVYTENMMKEEGK